MQTTTEGPAKGSPGGRPKWLSVAQLADELGFSVDQVRKWVRAGRVPGARKQAREWRINRAEWDANPQIRPNNSAPPTEATAEGAERSVQ